MNNMSNNKLFTTITNIIQQNGNKYSGNELFGLLSVLVMAEIIGIYKSNVKIDQNNNQNNPSSDDTGNIGNLAGLLGQFQGGNSNNNLQQMLPILMGALGGNNNSNDLDINKISSLLKSINKNKPEPVNNNENVENEDEEQIQNSDSKKKVSGK